MSRCPAFLSWRLILRAGILIAAYLKSSYGLGGVFAGISLIMLIAVCLTAIGYSFFLKRDLARSVAA